ncbi:MAG: flagellar filament capping protein FliD [Lachnospiraceae bacterium]
MPIRISGLNSGLDTESLVSELVSAYRTKGEKYEKEQTKISWKQEAWKSLSSKTYSFRNSLDKMRFSSGYNLKTTSVSNSSKATVTAGNNAVNGTQTLEITSLAKTGYLTGGKMSSANGTAVAASTTMGELGLSENGDISINGKRIQITGQMKVSEVISKFQDAGVSASFDATNQRIFVSSKESGKEADFALTALNGNGAKALSALGLNVKPADDDTTYAQYVNDYGSKTDDELRALLQSYDTTDSESDRLIASFAKEYKNADDAVTKDEVLQELKQFLSYAKDVQTKTDEELGYNTGKNTGKTGAVRIYGKNAEITLNGASFTSNSNSFSINGLTITAMALTEPGETLSITTSTDNQGIYDKIKDFLSEYNSIINSMTSSYNAASASDYEPLTDDEKESMSEKEIEKWEEKGKSAVLRRDSTLSTLMSAMTNAMSKSYTINGKSYALSSFGIKTLGITNAEKNEHNAYHIDGDADDENTSSNTDKLMAAIVADPDGVTQFFQKLSSDLYESLGKQMTSTTLRSYGSFYNDKELEKEYNSYTTKISDWEQKVSDIEDSYYKKFAAMESALSELQSQSSQLSGLLGM